MFSRRKLLIATRHHKEKVIAPILERELGVQCFVDPDFDTDALGTFTGEIERELDPISTAREKCRRAMQRNDCDLGVASEGSFGPHPTLYFLPADEEFLIFIDTQNHIEVTVREISTTTNFSGKQILTHNELMEFADQAGFPTHGLILRGSKQEYTDIHKGIRDRDSLQQAFDHLIARHKSVYVETDMRALHNPMRMQVIAAATEKLVQAIHFTCPNCHMPGFGVAEAIKGLACRLCGSPTNSTLSYVYKCQHCAFTQEERYPHQKTAEDPTFCDFCNP
jgi:hypothetical protein